MSEEKKYTLDEINSLLNQGKLFLNCRLQLNIPKWGIYDEGEEDNFMIPINDEQNGILRHPVDRRWDIVGTKLEIKE